MMKLSGALLLVLGCAGFGWCTCRDMERHIGQLHLLSRAFPCWRVKWVTAGLPCRRGLFVWETAWEDGWANAL